VGEKRPGEPRSVAGLSPGGTANGEGGEGTAAGEPMAPTRSWVKEPWKAGEGAPSGKSAAARVSGPGLVSAAAPAEEAPEEAKRDSTAERGGRASVGRGGRLGPSPAGPGAGAAAEASRAAMGRGVGEGERQRGAVRLCAGARLPPSLFLGTGEWAQPRLPERAGVGG
jgi:hypothetical protein